METTDVSRTDDYAHIFEPLRVLFRRLANNVGAFKKTIAVICTVALGGYE